VADWADRAACLGGDQRLWFPEKGDVLAVRAAKAVCRSCRVRGECLDAALSAPYFVKGIWGGLSEGERAHLARGRRAS
jgi:WhiB family redox-sensing transcriptional regulator